MIYALLFYWLIAAIVTFLINPQSIPKDALGFSIVILICLLFGGFVVPALILCRLVVR